MHKGKSRKPTDDPTYQDPDSGSGHNIRREMLGEINSGEGDQAGQPLEETCVPGIGAGENKCQGEGGHRMAGGKGDESGSLAQAWKLGKKLARPCGERPRSAKQVLQNLDREARDDYRK